MRAILRTKFYSCFALSESLAIFREKWVVCYYKSVFRIRWNLSMIFRWYFTSLNRLYWLRTWITVHQCVKKTEYGFYLTAIFQYKVRISGSVKERISNSVFIRKNMGQSKPVFCHIFPSAHYFLISYIFFTHTKYSQACLYGSITNPPVHQYRIRLLLYNECNFVNSAASVWIHRSSHRRCSFKKAVPKNFTIFTGKHLCWIKKKYFLDF